MKVTRQQAIENRTRVLRLAARRFRECGFQGLGVADLMKEAGMTHGGFYKQFQSKDDLVTQACALAIADNLSGYQKLIKQHPHDPLSAVISALVSDLHRDSSGDGCVMAALGGDIARSNKSIRHEVTLGVRKILDCLSGLIPGYSKKQARKKAISTYAAIVGSLVIARAVNDAELSHEILEATCELLMDDTKV